MVFFACISFFLLRNWWQLWKERECESEGRNISYNGMNFSFIDELFLCKMTGFRSFETFFLLLILYKSSRSFLSTNQIYDYWIAMARYFFEFLEKFLPLKKPLCSDECIMEKDTVKCIYNQSVYWKSHQP